MIINVKDIIEPTHKNVGVQCEISLSDLNRSCQTDRLESCDFEAQAPEYYSISANYVAVVNDHAYSKEKTVCFTPSKRKHVCEDVSLSPINSSLQSLPTDDEKDSDYIAESAEESINISDAHETERSILKEKKFVVFESMLDEIFNLLPCRSCDGTATSIEKHEQGTCVLYKGYCINEHVVFDWKSQPMLGKMPAFNLLLSSAIFCSGNTYERVKKVANFSGLNFVNQRTYYDVQRSLIIPTVNDHFVKNIASAREDSRGENEACLGDGRFDSPGKSAKYCTYSLQSSASNKIVATTTIQTTTGKGSAPLELQGFKNCLEQLSSDNYPVGRVATDRNRQIAKWIRENRLDIMHRYDPWHFAKNMKAKLRPLVKRKDRRILQDWIKPTGNHLFWCAENCQGDPELLVQMWKSILQHVTNKHNFAKQYPKYPRCRHEAYSSAEARKKKWIEKHLPAYNALEEIVLDKKNLKDMELLCEPYHTGGVEVFHSLITAYAPKRQHFELNVMNARVKLAILDHNNNVGRKQAVVKCARKGSQKVGEKKWKFVSSKLNKEWVAKPVKEPKSFSFVDAIMNDIIERKESGVKVKISGKEVVNKLSRPRNIAHTARPDTSKILLLLFV
ncbi:uncharacterized protein LOC130626005 [Hydractinia symbiolongicarpus]|uniref:uncharacterized protein LOC130626005 n=1 Tax=Hydractinia symbiolongicarpus TaxID=13093 RepID=UPI00255023B7|nr:uncharacterized protein LOC130626005 [Hydractinia symbiolongicarpus]